MTQPMTSHRSASGSLLSLRRLPLVAALVAALAAPVAAFAQTDAYAEVNRLLRAGQASEALSMAEQYLTNRPNDPQMRFLKGVVQTESGKTADAIATFTKLTEDYPELPEPYNNLAVLYAGQSQFDKARAALEMAIRTNPSYATAHENLGDVYAKLASQTMGNAKVLAFGPPAEALEGQWHGTQTVLLEFESVEAAKEWYYSDEYQAAAKLRQAAADCNGIVISGL